jgi:hypothetical protein
MHTSQRSSEAAAPKIKPGSISSKGGNMDRSPWLTPFRLIAVLFGGVILLWIWWWTHGIHIVAAKLVETQTLGQVGDLFGGINALFAAFAFAGVGVAAYYQHLSWKLLSVGGRESSE